jgi:hypothetical protein
MVLFLSKSCRPSAGALNVDPHRVQDLRGRKSGEERRKA